MEGFLAAVMIFYKLLDTTFIEEGFPLLLTRPFIFEVDLDTLIQESHFSQTAFQNIIFKYSGFENFRVRPESCLGTGLFGSSNDFQRRHSSSSFISLSVDISVTLDFHFHMGGKGIYDRSTYTMETPGYLISSAAEFTAGMEHGMNHFHCGDSHLRMDINRHASSIVFHHNGIILLDGNMDILTVASKCFVDTVVYDFVNQVVQTSRAGGTDIHPWSLTNCFQTFQNLYLRRIILAVHFFF